MPKRTVLILIVTLTTLISGLLNLYAALHPPLHNYHAWLPDAFPLEFFHFPRSFTLLIGFTLIVAALNIWKRKRRAYQIALTRSSLSVSQERMLARQILALYGGTAMDFFKLWPDKAYFFNTTQEAFIAYRVAANMAVALADPVGPPQQLEGTIRQFKQFCDDNGWRLAFHQTLPDLLPLYRRQGFKKLKVGDDAFVTLTQFSLTDKRLKRFRQRVGQLEKHGIRFRYYTAPISAALLAQLKTVSDEWLQLPGRRERSFTVGSFVPEYLRATPIFTAEDASGKVLAFVNLLPSYRPGEATIDLMRHGLQAPNGIMDYLFVRLFLWCKEHGDTRFNLGLAPMAGFQEREEASVAERAVHAFFQHLNFLFSFSGLKQYKAKFADHWEPRYEIYSHIFDLPKLGLALNQITEVGKQDSQLMKISKTYEDNFSFTSQPEERAGRFGIPVS